jgi:7-cyano-7-deazaguanine synthase in queuosine biosynthesis
MEPHALTLNQAPRFGGGVTLQGIQSKQFPRRTRSLILWSGGIDSTYTLVRLLRTTDDQVFTHHVRIMDANGSRQSGYESSAIDALRKSLMRSERAFEHTASSVDLRQLSGRGVDSSILAFMAAQAAMTHDLTPYDRILVGVNGDVDPGWDPETAACALRRARIARALRAAWGCDEVPQVYLWLPRPHRSQMTEFLGSQLMALTASCLRPVKMSSSGQQRDVMPAFKACGECAKCRCRDKACDVVDEADVETDVVAVATTSNGATTRKPHLFHHLEALQNKRLALQGEVATSDRPAP